MGAEGYSLQVSTMGKWEIEKKFRDNDFGLWKVKMQAILTQEKCIEAMKDETSIPGRLTQAKKIEMMDKVMSVIILVLVDKVLREVDRE